MCVPMYHMFYNILCLNVFANVMQLFYSLVLFNLLVICAFANNGRVWNQMAYELHGLLAGNVSIVTGENIKPSYGGDDEAFLRKVISPLYQVIEKV